MSVKHVIGLAGVSRRAFYEQFANKEDCFMETFDLILNRTFKRVTVACRASNGPLENRLRAGLRAFVEEVQTNSKALRLVAIDALTAGPEGVLRQRRSLAAAEQLVAGSFAAPPSGNELPSPLVRAIVGGLHRATLLRLSTAGRYDDSQSVLTGEMLRWMMLFSSPAIDGLRLRATTQHSLPRAVQPRQPAAGDRERLLESIVDLALREPFEELSAPHIAHEAGLPIDTFLDLFESREDCFVAALDMLGGDLLEAVADPALVSQQWPVAVCQAIDRLTAHLAGNPACAVMLAAKTLPAGIAVVEEMVLLADEVATLLTEGAPRRGTRNRLASTLISGALAYTLHTEVMAGRAHLLRSLSDYLSYVVLAPFIGPERAAQTVAEAATAPAAQSVSPAASSARDAEPQSMSPAQAQDTRTDSTDSGQAEPASGQAEPALPVDAATSQPAPTTPAQETSVQTPEQTSPVPAGTDSPTLAETDPPTLTETEPTLAETEPPTIAGADPPTLDMVSATPARAPLGEVREHDADEQGDHDHDDQRSLA
jgi:AcrR family transcriptional regulator